ncbi:AraC family transcriptional regulator [Gorillibacterium massiliense]|uniref:AraC family transcriptional regulator n=1 Tax=Gorillibacterium massiliense TaxID=1280390 RepID=UPI0004B08C6A|nr:AraC family transcriptional regulator [Gorillibacterium massiliense]
MASDSSISRGTFGFRFSTPDQLAMCNLFAVGQDTIRDSSYRWDGLTRTDGPLLLFQYTLEGEGVFESGKIKHQIQAGQAFMAEIPSDHRYYFPEGGDRWSFLFLLMRPDLILPNWLDAKERLGETPELPPESRPIQLLRSIWNEANGGRINEAYTSSSYVYQFVSELCRFAAVPRGDRREWPEKVRQAVDYIHANYEKMISLELLSDRLDVSKYHFLRIFTSAVGVSPSDYVNRVRIEQAIRLLRETDISVERIAEQVGYSGGSYFIKVFRKMTGRTPGSFRSEAGQLTFNRIYFD